MNPLLFLLLALIPLGSAAQTLGYIPESPYIEDCFLDEQGLIREKAKILLTENGDIWMAGSGGVFNAGVNQLSKNLKLKKGEKLRDNHRYRPEFLFENKGKIHIGGCAFADKKDCIIETETSHGFLRTYDPSGTMEKMVEFTANATLQAYPAAPAHLPNDLIIVPFAFNDNFTRFSSAFSILNSDWEVQKSVLLPSPRNLWAEIAVPASGSTAILYGYEETNLRHTGVRFFRVNTAGEILWEKEKAAQSVERILPAGKGEYFIVGTLLQQQKFIWKMNEDGEFLSETEVKAPRIRILADAAISGENCLFLSYEDVHPQVKTAGTTIWLTITDLNGNVKDHIEFTAPQGTIQASELQLKGSQAYITGSIEIAGINRGFPRAFLIRTKALPLD